MRILCQMVGSPAELHLPLDFETLVCQQQGQAGGGSDKTQVVMGVRACGCLRWLSYLLAVPGAERQHYIGFYRHRDRCY